MPLHLRHTEHFPGLSLEGAVIGSRAGAAQIVLDVENIFLGQVIEVAKEEVFRVPCDDHPGP